MTSVVAINLRDRFAVLSDDSFVPITNLLDVIGDETNDPAEAVSFVAGQGREWFSQLLSDFMPSACQ